MRPFIGAASPAFIEPLRTEHLRELAAVLRDDAVYAHIGGIVPSEDAFIEGLAFALRGAPPGRDEVWLNYLVRAAGNGPMLGRLEATIVADRAELAFLLAPAVWGRGIAADGLQWLERTVIDAYGVASLWATTVPVNTRCRRLLEAAGYATVDVADAPALGSYDAGDLIYRKSAR